MTDDFGYLNARLRVRRSRLLPEGFFNEALRLGFPELVKVLGETVYGPDLTGEDLADVDQAAMAHLNRTVGDLPRLVAGEAREAVSLLLLRSDLANVRTILRGKQAGWTGEEIMGHLGAGTIPPALYGHLVEAPDAASLAQLLTLPRHPIARALREAVAASREPLEMEITLDRRFYAALLRRAQELNQPYLASFMRFEIDALNLATGLKLSTVGFAGELPRFFLPGGRCVGQPLFELLAAGEVAALEELSNTDFARVTEVRDLSTLERELRCLLLAKAKAGVKDVLGAGMANDYILQKEWEAGRIRLLARRAFFGLPPGAVEPEVFCR
ncbi:MAG: V-type ATPase subunit [Deltaproteobacteria bacterium]